MTLSALKERWTEALSYRGRCRRCSSPRVWHNGIRLRKASLVVEGQTVYVADIPVRRLRCGDCLFRFSHAPEGVESRGHYQASVVAEAVATTTLDEVASDGQVAKEHGCSRRTVSRWVVRVAQVAEPGELMKRLLEESGHPVVPAPVVVRRRRSARLFALCQRAALVLSLLEALASHGGLEPPGLGHAQRFVPAAVPPTVAGDVAASLE